MRSRARARQARHGSGDEGVVGLGLPPGEGVGCRGSRRRLYYTAVKERKTLPCRDTSKL